MKSLPWFPLYASDWLSSPRIASMTIEQEGAYHRLLCYAWTDADCSLPTDLITLSRLARVTSESLTQVLACFEPHPTKKKRLCNPRLLKEWETSKRIQRERSESGTMGALKRWHSGAIAEPKQRHSILQSQSQSQKERKNLKIPERVSRKLEDRDGKGFSPLVEEVVKAAQSWSKEIP